MEENITSNPNPNPNRQTESNEGNDGDVGRGVAHEADDSILTSATQPPIDPNRSGHTVVNSDTSLHQSNEALNDDKWISNMISKEKEKCEQWITLFDPNNYQCEGMAEELRIWRDQYTITDYKDMCRHLADDKYSVAIAASGGCLDTLASIRAGLFPVWGSEVDPNMQRMFKDLTGARSLGDARNINPNSVRRPKILKSGFPCKSYSRQGNQQGADDPEGQLFTWQGKWIRDIEPDIAVIEQTDNAMEINDGADVDMLVSELEKTYVVHKYLIPVWCFGDVSSRVRLIIIAIHNKFGANATTFTLPDAPYDESRFPVALDIADEDADIEDEYILHDSPTTRHAWYDPKPGEIHHIGRSGEGIGHCDAPHNFESLWGLPNTQLTSNGGARRPMKSWRPWQELHTTHLSTLGETIRIANLTQTYRH